MNHKKLIFLSFLMVTTYSIYAQNKSSYKHKNYLFFLHNRFTEENQLDAIHPEYGKSQYQEITEVFKKAGLEVITEKRPAGTDITLYANKVVGQIDSLKSLGVRGDHITVLGLSKGGYIAQIVSTLLAQPIVNFVFIGCYRETDLVKLPQINFCGNILTIYERSDEFGVSAINRKTSSKLKVTRFKELELHTGLKHGFLFKPMDLWTSPVIRWAKRKYNPH